MGSRAHFQIRGRCGRCYESICSSTVEYTNISKTLPSLNVVMMDAQTSSLRIDVSDCVPVSEYSTGSPDSVGWSPHNILHVATQFAVFLHANELTAADAIIRPVYLPRADDASPMCISGAKWALGLTSDNMYPSTCRLCVLTTRDLFIYRVVRYGNGRVRTSAALCIIPSQRPAQTQIGETSPDFKKSVKRRGRDGLELLLRGDIDEDCGSDDGGGEPVRRWGNKTFDVIGECIIGYEWFPRDLLVVVTFRSIYIVDEPNKANSVDEGKESQQQREYLPPPSYRFTGNPEASLRPSCAARVVGANAESMRLVVASPLFLRVFSISVEGGVNLLCCVQIPLLGGVPASLCCVQASEERPDIRVLVSVPLHVIHGNIIMSGAVGEPHNRGEGFRGGSCVAATAEQTAEWQLVNVWGCESGFGDDITVSRFVTISLGSFALRGSDFTIPSSVAGGGPFVVLGVCRRRLVGFFGKSCINLIQCSRMDCFVPPDEEGTELTGLAFHPSCTLAVVALQTASRRHPPFQLFPCPVERSGGFLERLLYFQEGFASVFDVEQSQARGVHGPALAGRVSALNNLQCRQTSTSYFMWEKLLPRSALSRNFLQGDGLRQYGSCRLPLISCPALLDSSDASPGLLAALRMTYLNLRCEYGIELFLRFPESNALWRQTLIRLQRLSVDSYVITELILANAIQLLADKVSYSGFRRDGFQKCALPNDEYSLSLAYAAALQFIRLYHQMCEEKEADEMWSHSGEFKKQLNKFMACLEREGGGNGISNKGQPEPDPRFPCSVCGEVEKNRLSLSLFSRNQNVPKEGEQTTSDCSEGHHITAFSGRNFATLCFLSQDEVLSQCHACSVFDYAVGPYCGVCEGLMA